MQYENYEQAKSIVETIQKHNKILDDLNEKDICLKIMQGTYCIMTIGAWNSCEHSDKQIAIDFIELLKSTYEERVKKLKRDLSEL